MTDKKPNSESRKESEYWRNFIKEASQDDLVEGLVQYSSKDLEKLLKAVTESYETAADITETKYDINLD